MARLKEKIVNCLEESGKNFQLTLDYICTLVKILKSIQKTSHTMFNIHFMTSDFPKLVNEQLKTENSLIFRYQVKILHSIELERQLNSLISTSIYVLEAQTLFQFFQSLNYN